MNNEYNFIHFEDIPIGQSCVKFKEFYFNKDFNKWLPTHSDGYYRINIDKVDSILLQKTDKLTTILGMVGMFFI